MARSRDRCFSNTLPDYTSDSEILTKDWKPAIFDIVNKIINGQKLSRQDCEGGLYVGIGGVLYMFYHLHEHQDFSEDAETSSRLLSVGGNYNRALQLFMNSQGSQRPKDEIGFFLGHSGIYALRAAFGKMQGDHSIFQENLDRFRALARHCLPIDFLSYGSDEMLVGRAGYICGVLWLQKVLNQPVLSDDVLFAICDSVVTSGKDYSRRHNSPCALMYSYYQTEYLGAAHGLSAILQMLLSVPNYLSSHPEAESLVKTSIDFYLTLQQPCGNFPAALDEVDKHGRADARLVHWCHGAPGAVYLFAKAYLVYRDQKYLDACIRCGEITWHKGLLKKGPGICHGIAGSGYVFLLLYRLTGDKRHLHRAQQFATFMFTSEFQREARTPDCPYSLFEGVAGTVCFLADLIRPQQAAFPFFDVF